MTARARSNSSSPFVVAAARSNSPELEPHPVGARIPSSSPSSSPSLLARLPQSRAAPRCRGARPLPQLPCPARASSRMPIPAAVARTARMNRRLPQSLATSDAVQHYILAPQATPLTAVPRPAPFVSYLCRSACLVFIARAVTMPHRSRPSARRLWRTKAKLKGEDVTGRSCHLSLPLCTLPLSLYSVVASRFFSMFLLLAVAALACSLALACHFVFAAMHT